MNRPSSFCRISFALATFFAVCVPAVALVNPGIAHATNITFDTIVGPTGSGEFGNATLSSSYTQNIIVLANGNIVISDPGFDSGGVTDVGAVHVYDGTTRGRLSTLTGQTINDRVGISVYTLIGSSNFVVASPTWDRGSTNSAGAVTWINGTTGLPHGETENQTKSYTVSITNSLVGRFNQDLVGSGGVVSLTNGNYVASSPSANVGVATDNGAATWGNGNTGIAGVISATNSLIGSSNFDRVAFTSNTNSTLFIPMFNSVMGIKALPNGNYVVSSPSWNNGSLVNNVNSGTIDVGAVTWGNGTTGTVGEVTTTNSITGSTTEDFVGNVEVNVGISSSRLREQDTTSTTNGVEVLANGNYVVRSVMLDGATAANVGAVTWVNGTNGRAVGESQPGATVSVSNSLIGTSTDDRVGITGVTTLSNGNYVVRTAIWNSTTATDAGAVTHGNGTTGTVGEVSAINSLTGTTTEDFVGSGSVSELTNGNYVIVSQDWDGASAINVGAVTWVNGTTGITGAVSTANSLHGTTAGDRIGSRITTLANGNYVVFSETWDNGGVADVGAVTWVDGTIGYASGETSPGVAVTTTNSLHGTTTTDKVGSRGVTALTNGNYVVSSDLWNNGVVADVGAVTWGDGTVGTTGAVSTINSLHGTSASDSVGSPGVTALTNGNYVVRSTKWNLTSPSNVNDVGAVTWGDGTTGITGAVSTINSLHGTSASDEIGSTGLIAIPNGNYVVFSRIWDLSASITNVGAVTWGDGTTGITGPITTANSLHGSTTNDEVGNASSSSASFVIPTGSEQNNLILRSPLWDNTDTSPATANTGAITLFSTSTSGPRTTGPITSSNSARGTVLNQYLGNVAPVRFDSIHNRIYVHTSNSNNTVTILAFTTPTPPPAPAPDPNTPTQGSQGSDNSGSNTNATTDSAPVSAGTNTESVTSSPNTVLKRSSLPQTGSQNTRSALLFAGILILLGVIALRVDANCRDRRVTKQRTN